MAVNLEGGAPYAPATAVLEFIKRNRNGGVPIPVTLQTLERLGISESLRPRTLQALRQLDFIDADGNLTPEFENLRKLPTPDYLPGLAELLRSAYADVFAIVDPSNATYENVTDAFRGFTPAGQMPRMVALFLSLLEYTGLWDGLPSSRSAVSPGTARGVSKRTGSGNRKSPAKREPEPQVSTVQPVVAAVTQAPPAASPDDMKRAYFDLLIEKAKTGDADRELFDRIERLIGVAQPEAAADGRGTPGVAAMGGESS